jgi:hypothetical protein
MSPTASESVPNRALNGTELKALILDDFQRLLDNDGMLSEHLAFGRVGYDIILRLHLDNASQDVTESHVKSRPRAKQQVEKNPALSAVQTAPLPTPSPGAVVAGTQISRSVDSPNSERLRLGLPIPVDVRQSDRTIITEQVQYPRDESLGDGNVQERDVTGDARAAWNLLNETQEVTVPEDDDNFEPPTVGNEVV